jgi:hypothetical protein
MLVALKAVWSALQASLVYHIGSATLPVCLQVQQENTLAWQSFCCTSLKVTPSDAASGPAYWQGQQAWQSKQGDLYQHRLPQLGSRMQQLLVEAAAAWLASTEGATLAHICALSLELLETMWNSLAVHRCCLFSMELCAHCQCKPQSFELCSDS